MDNINTREYWNKIWCGEGYATWRKYPKTFSEISKEVGKEKRVLDVGCGVGLLLNILEQNNYVEGVDISDEAIKTLSLFGIKGKAAKIPPLPFEDNEFDVIVASEFLEHFIDVNSILLELKRAAEKVIISVPDNILGPEEEKEHFQKFTSGSLQNLLMRHFRSVKIKKFTDSFPSPDPHVTIALPTLLAVCEIPK